jgi:Mg/Co/Ni transporter MgtE
VPVVDAERHLVGIVTVDDAIDTILPASWRRRVSRAGSRE